MSSARAQRSDNYPPTNNKNVRLTQTNLPIVFMSVDGQTIQREERITARAKIIDNGAGQLNYGDTIAHPGQKVDYEGYVGLKYRGNSSFNSSDKKPYSFRPYDKPVEQGGKKQKVSILGMGKDNDWALLAPFSDKTMMRDLLSFELARPYFDYVPHGKYCELVLDGIYYGVYIMSERVGKGKNRLDLNDPGEDGGDLTGDYQVEIDRDDEPDYYRSKYHPLDGEGREMTGKYITYQYSSPESDDFAELPPGTKEALHKQIDDMEASFTTDYYTDPERGYRKYIDVTSFIDYLLSTEFAFDIDGYRLSTNLYKYGEVRAAQEGLDSRWKMSLWDKNIAFGNANYNNGWRTDLWQYDFNARSDDPQSVPFWWSKMLDDDSFVDEMKARWQEYRSGGYADERVWTKVDSLARMLTSGGAVDRNQSAWAIIGHSVWPNYFNGSTYSEEVDYLKGWIKKRLRFMDRNLLPRDPNFRTVPVTIKSGLSHDVIVEASPANSYATGAVDGNLTFYAQSLREDGGLPDSRDIVSAEGVTYRLAPYDAANALLLGSKGDAGEIVFDEPFATKELYFLATSANGQSDIEVTVNYGDGTSSSAESFSVRDWSVSNPQGDEAVTALGRVSLGNTSISGNNHYCMFEFSVVPESGKQVKSVTVRSVGNALPSVYAFSRVDNVLDGIDLPSGPAVREVVGVYTVDGVKISTPRKGLNIVRYSDGTVRKVMVR